MVINSQLIQWNSRWMIMGDFVACKACLLPQQVNDADLPFDHDGACPLFDQGPHYPWWDLIEVLATIPAKR